MVQEIRQIMLKGEELITALECYRRMHPEFLPAGKITRCILAESMASAVTVSVEMSSSGKTRQADFTLQGLDILKPVIRFCIENNIPLPKDGRKSVYISQDSVSLWVTLNLDAEIPVWTAPMKLTHLDALTALTPADIMCSEQRSRAKS